MPSYTRSYAATTPGRALSQDESKAVLGQTMGLVALTLGFLALGAYLARNFTGGSGIAFFIAGFACIFGLQFATARGHEQIAIALLFGLGLLLGMFVGPVLAYYAKSDPAPLWQAAGATGGFVLAAGSYGYATRRDLSSWARGLFWALIALIVFGMISLFVAIPGGNIIYCLAGLVIFGGFTIIDFNRLRRSNLASAPILAAAIFLDIFNVFLFFLSLFGGNGRR